MLKKLSKPTLILALLLVLSSFVSHKFYVSHYTIEHKNAALQITAKVFTDDLEKALQQKEPALRIDERSDPKILGPKILAYFKEHFKLKSDKALNYEWVGYELEQDLVWIYLEVPSLPQAPKSLEINCDVLTEVYEGQINLFRVDCGDLEETFSLRKEETTKNLSN